MYDQNAQSVVTLYLTPYDGEREEARVKGGWMRDKGERRRERRGKRRETRDERWQRRGERREARKKGGNEGQRARGKGKGK